MFGRRAAGCLLSRAAVLVIALHAAPAPDHDYLTPELRARVESLKAGVQRTPTNADNRSQRARILWEWVNAYALTGNDIPVDATRVAQTTLTYPTAVANDASIAAMVREFTVLDEQPDAIGTLEADTGPFEANAFATFTQTYTVGANAIETGGGLLIARHFGVDLNGELQAKDPAAPNFVTIAASNPNVSFTNAVHGMAGMHGGFRQSRDTLVFRLAAGRLAQGEALTITYGDTSGGGPGVKMPSLSSDKIPFPIYLDFDGSDDFFTLPIQPIRVTGTRVAGVHAFAPSIVEPGEPFDLAVRAEDQFANRARPPIPSWNVYINGELHTAIPAGGPPIVVLEDLTVDAPGVVRFTIESSDGRIAGRANPILVVQDPPHRIFWGDTHGHSGFAEGIGTPDRFMTWARDDARLDYVVHSEHDIWMDDFEWQTLRDNVRSYSRAGEFVAFLGYEWTVRNFQGGHHNVIFRNPAQRERIISPFYPTLSDLYLGLRRYHDPKDVVVIPHAHQAGDYRLSDPLLEPLVEVLSMHGTFEWFARAYLQHGHQVGFTAASDNHASQPGYSAPRGTSLAQRGGLGALLAPAKTRDQLFDAMKDMKAYATSGERIIVDFNVNGAEMGTRIAFTPNRLITGRVIGTAPIDTVVLVKNGEILWERDYATDVDARTPRQGEFVLSFQTDSIPLHPGDNPRGWRHWRGILEVKGADIDAIQPLDFASATQTIEQLDENRYRFRTYTRGDTSSLKLKLSNVRRSTTFALELEEARETGGAPLLFSERNVTPAAQINLAVRDMEQGTVSETITLGPYVDRISVRRIIAEGTTDVTFEVEDTSGIQGDYYYLRVTQLNDAIAWSSPIWVGGYPPR